MSYTKTNWVNDQAPAINATNLNNIENGIANSYNVALLAVDDTAPSECSTGDKYYNTTTKKIYTATGTDTWGTTGEDPLQDIFYIVFDTKTSYSYDGTDLVSVGGGGAEVAISTTTPTEDEIVWINPNDSVDVYGNYISNEYGTSQTIGYSQEYSNKHFGGELLWTNSHPDSEFGAQSVSIDLSNYRYIEIYYNRWQGTTLLYHKIYFEENSTIYSQLTYSDYDSGEVRSWNRVLTINNSGIGFNVNQINGATSNYGLIPYKIIGYK